MGRQVQATLQKHISYCREGREVGRGTGSVPEPCHPANNPLIPHTEEADQKGPLNKQGLGSEQPGT